MSMKKNKNGFTLVELLAAIVILGIISVFAFPVITRMIESSRNKMYVNDAKKLISRAEYQMKASNTVIQKPDPGDVIVISMAYLGAKEFDSAPNGGEYNEDQSYVVIKNVAGQLEASVTIIENLPKEGGYKGLKLISYENLLKKDALAKVTPIEESELIDIENDVTRSYLNRQLGNNYIPSGNTVTAIYHNHEINDSSIQKIKDSTPVIKDATFTPKNGGRVSTLEAVLSIKASDDDTNRSDLIVYYSTNGFELTNRKPYGTNTYHTINFDFGKAPFNYDYSMSHKVSVYVTIADPEGHIVQKKYDYTISANEAPSILMDQSSLKKRNNDNAAMTTATLTLGIADDLDSTENLKVCFAETTTNQKASSCSNYVPYNSLFKNGNTYDYQFNQCNNGTCARDGKTHYLTVFVQDSSGFTTSEIFPYTFSSNIKPQITENIKVTSVSNQVPSEGNLNVLVRVRASDDVTDANHLKVYISVSGVSNSQKEYSYSSDNNKNTFSYLIPGGYDGSTKTIAVYVVDEEGAQSDVKTATYKVYKNKAPEISYFYVSSDGMVCEKGNLCATVEEGDTTKNGSLNAIIKLGVSDDIDTDENINNLQVCVSEERAFCNDNGNFDSYSKYREKKYTFQGTYDGSTRTMYAVVKDSYGNKSEKSYHYVLYKDQAPVINNFSLISKIDNFVPEAGGTLDANIWIEALDDFADDDHLLLTLKRNGSVFLEGVPISSLYEFVENADVTDDDNITKMVQFKYAIRVADDYDGSTIHFEATIKDDKGKVSQPASFDYVVYQNQPPTTNGDAKIVRAYNPYNLNLPDLYFYPKFRDDVDTVFDVQYCYYVGTNSASPTCTNQIHTNGMYHLDESNLFQNIKYQGQTIKIYAIAADSSGKTVKTNEVSYTLYNDTSPEILSATATTAGNSQSSDSREVEIDFQVRYFSGRYAVCIKETDTNCSESDYGEYYSGTDFLNHTIQYSYSKDITSSSKLYMKVKGDNSTSGVKKKTLTITSGGTCTVKDLNSAYYTYQSATQTPISASRCDYKCYNFDPTTNANIGRNSFYTTTISYKDKLGNSCNNFNVIKQNDPKECNFIDCFKNGTNNYETNAIGILLIDDAVPWTEEINGVTYVNYNHYQLYKSSYQLGDESITLTKQTRRISPTALNTGKYSFTYVRVIDP